MWTEIMNIALSWDDHTFKSKILQNKLEEQNSK
jgi:hypothetical protein